jgi:preprotein translocase subunit YajC
MPDPVGPVRGTTVLPACRADHYIPGFVSPRFPVSAMPDPAVPFPSALSATLVAQAGQPRPQPGGLELVLTYLPMLLIVLVAWLLLYRPERERQRRQQELLTALKKNDRVVTASGIYGIVANVDRENDRVTLKVDEAANVKMTVTLSSVSKVLAATADDATADA